MDFYELFYKKKYEGKPLLYKIKYSFAHVPELAYFGIIAYGLVFPMVYYYKAYKGTGTRREALQKYKIVYTVVRDDDPKVPEIIKEKAFGRHLFPQY